jgi:hypothetical protein
MPVYDYDTYRDLKVFKANVKNNKHAMIMFSGTWYPSLTKELSAVCDHVTLYYADVFDVYVVSSEIDYNSLYFSDNIYDLFKYFRKSYYSITCCCFCISTAFISNIIYKLNKTDSTIKISAIAYESAFNNYKQGFMNPCCAVDMNHGYLNGNKRATPSIIEYLNARQLLQNVISDIMKKHSCSLRTVIKAMSINMKSRYSLYHISSVNDQCFDYETNMQLQKKMKKHRDFVLRCYTLYSYSHTFLLKNPLLFEQKQIELFYQHLDDIIARIIQ